MNKKAFLLWGMILLGFAFIEFPGIFFINRIEPRIFGLPFIYGATLLVWAYLCALLFIGHKKKWYFKEESDKTKEK